MKWRLWVWRKRILQKKSKFIHKKLYAVMNEIERRQLMEALISEIQIYEDRQSNGQWLKSIKFRLPIIEEDMDLNLDNDEHMEVVCLLSKT